MFFLLNTRGMIHIHVFHGHEMIINQFTFMVLKYLNTQLTWAFRGAKLGKIIHMNPYVLRLYVIRKFQVQYTA